jgi:hypothetical protein
VSETPKSHSELVLESAEARLAQFRNKPTEPTSRAVLGDRELEGQMRSLSGVCFQLGLSTAAKAEVGACVAVGYKSNGEHRMRIYRKLGGGWTQHTFALVVTKARVGGGRGTIGRRQSVYTWDTHAPQRSGQHQLPTRQHA